MSRFPDVAAAAAALMTAALMTAALATAGPATADGYGLGRPASPEEVAAWNIDVRPDGLGLPAGRGNAIDGEDRYMEHCAVCHGDFAEGAERWPVLAGGRDTLTDDRPVKTIGSYWPYASTVWDYVHRAMPFGNAQSLSDDDVYAITAYLLYMNDIIDDDFELDATTFPTVEMPNADGFFMDDRLDSPVFADREACMTDCKDAVEITMRAAVRDVTPGTADEPRPASPADGAPAGGHGAEAPTPEAARAAALDADLVAHGEKVWRRCKSCHQVGDGAANRVGPHLNGIYDRGAAEVDGFTYSGALSKAAADGLVWNAEALDSFLERPRKYLKGTRMVFGGLRKEKDRLAIIEFLKSVSR